LTARVKLALIERASALVFNSVREAERLLNVVVQGKTLPTPSPVDLSTMMLTEKFERRAEAIRRALPELVKLDRYECRVARRCDKAIQMAIKDSDLN
jgi:hypothetical protein